MANKLTFVAQSAEEAEDLRARGVAYEYEGQTYEPDVPVAKNEDEFKALWNDGVKFEYDGVLYPSDVKERNRLIENSKGLAKIFMQVMGAEGESLDDLLAQSAEVAKVRQMDKLKELSMRAAKAALTYFDFMASEVIEALREADPADSSRTVAEALTERQRDFWAFPYTDNPLIEGFGAQTLITGMPAIEAVEERRAEVIELIGAGTYEMAFEASKRIGQDFDLLLEGMKDGSVRTPEGHAWPTYSADTLAWVDNERGGATLDHIKAGEPDLTLLTAMLGMGDEERLYEGYAPADEQTRRAIAEGEETPVGRPLTLLLDYRRNHDLQFDALNVLCNRGYEAQLRAVLRPKQTRQKRATAQKITAPNDAVSNALFYRPPNAFTPADYMTGTPKEIKTGNGLSVLVTLDNDFAIDEVFEAYQLDSRDRQWHDLALSLAEEGHESFRGSDLLTLAGYKKPTAKTMQRTMTEANQSLLKMRRHDVLIDTTGERKEYKNKRGADLSKATTLTRILDADITYLNFEDGVNDFEVKLKTSADHPPITAFALGSYAKAKKQLITYSEHDFVFEGLSLRDDHRRMWKYIIHRLNEHKTSNTIKIETLLTNTNLETIGPDKKKRLLDQLRKMLDVRTAEYERLEALRAKETSGARLSVKERRDMERLEAMTLIQGYKLKRKGKGGAVYAVEIVKPGAKN